jgi:DNA-binding MarR family transcriptional regulator
MVHVTNRPLDRAVDGAVVAIEDAIVTIVREATSARVQERFVAQSGVGLERAAYVLLRAVADRGTLRMTELAHDLGLDTSTVSRHVKALEAQGLLTRREDPGDRRAARVALSAAGTRTLERLQATRHRFFAEVLTDWPAQDRDQLAPLLSRLARDLLVLGGRL